MPDQQLHIHLGSWKTGTTTLQTVMRKNKKYLAQAGVHFADQRGETHTQEFAPLFRKAIRLALTGQPDSAEIADQARQSFINISESSSAPHVIHSWEPFLGHPFQNHHGVMYHAEATASWFEPIVERVPTSFTIYTRYQPDFIEAMYAQEVRKGRFLGSMEEFLRNLPENLSWIPVVAPFVRRYGLENVRVIPFETVRQGTNEFVHEFFSRITTLPDNAIVEHSNPSFSHMAVEIARQTYPLVEESEYPAIERFLVQNFSNKTHSRCQFLTPNDRLRIAVEVSAENDQLFREFIPDRDPRKFGYLQPVGAGESISLYPLTFGSSDKSHAEPERRLLLADPIGCGSFVKTTRTPYVSLHAPWPRSRPLKVSIHQLRHGKRMATVTFDWQKNGDGTGLVLLPRTRELQVEVEGDAIEFDATAAELEIAPGHLPEKMLFDDSRTRVLLADKTERETSVVSSTANPSISPFITSTSHPSDERVSGNQVPLLFITVDVEDTYFHDGLMIHGGETGAPATREIAKALEARGLKGVFFVNVYESADLGDRFAIEQLIRELADAGHEIGLHCHPARNLAFYNDDLTEYGYSDQCRILEHGKKFIRDATGLEPVSFRAGGYLHNTDTLRALATLGFLVDSSSLLTFAPEVPGRARINEPYLLDSPLVEIPVTYVPTVRGRGRIKHSKMDVNWLSGEELLSVTDGAVEDGRSCLNFMMHSFSFIDRKKQKPGAEEVLSRPVIARSEPNRLGVSIQVFGERPGLFRRFEQFLDGLGERPVRVSTFAQAHNQVLKDIEQGRRGEDSARFVYRDLALDQPPPHTSDPMQKNQDSSDVSIVDQHDRVTEAYYGQLGERFMQETQRRVNWVCEQAIGSRVLDVGCSQGLVPILLGREGYQVIGVDSSAKAIDEAHQYLASESSQVGQQVRFLQADFNSAEFEEGERFDTVIMSEVLEHLVQPERFVMKAAALLQEQGKLIVTVPFGINDYIDHKRTYYLNEIYGLIAARFESVEASFLGGWLGISAVGPRPEEREVPSLDTALIGRLEEAFFILEQRLREDIRERTRKMSIMRQQLEGARTSVQELKTSLASQSALVKAGSARASEQTGRIEDLSRRLGESKEALKRSESEREGLAAKLADQNRELEAREEERKVLAARLNDFEEERRQWGASLREWEAGRVEAASNAADQAAKIQRLEGEIRGAKKKLVGLRGSATYRAGVYVREATSPRGFLRMVPGLARLFREQRARPASRDRSPPASPQNAQPQPQPQPQPPEPQSRPPGELKNEASVIGWPELARDSRKPTMIGIMDEFSHGCFEPDANLVLPRPDNYPALIESSNPTVVLIESAWKGNWGSWQYRVGRYANAPGPEVAELTAFCKARDLPVVFWNKEDPVHYQKFLDTARHADYVFTTDANMIPSYVSATGGQAVGALPFAAQPRLHSPAPLANRNHRVCFAGSWYGNRHEARGEAMAWLLEAGSHHDLDIYDRNSGTGNFEFPEPLQKHIRGRLPYEALCAEYRNYRLFLNVNSVADSPTMCSRRVFELLACGTPVVSTFARGIDELIGSDVVRFVANADEAREAIQALLEDDREWRRRSLLGIRRVFGAHTYRHRLNQIYEAVGLEQPFDLTPRLDIYCRIDDELGLEAALAFKAGQRYANFRMISEGDFEPAKVRVRLGGDAEEAGSSAPARYAGSIDLRADYGEDYLTDLVNAVQQAPDARCWGSTAGESAFCRGGRVYRQAALFRTDEFASPTDGQAYCSGPDVYAIDTDMFHPAVQRG